MHIALLTDGISPYVTGGMQRHSYHLARNLLRKGVRLTLVHTVYDDVEMPGEAGVRDLLGASENQLDVIGIPFPQRPRIPGHYLRESYRFSVDIFEALKNEWVNFDFIYAKGFTAWCLLEHKKKGTHIAPVGVKFHGYEMFQKPANIKGKLTQYLLRPPVVFINRNANVVFSYGGEITTIIEKTGVDSEAIVEIGSGVDEEWILPEPLPQKGIRKFLFIGRNERRKGIQELEQCAGIFEETGTELHWVGPLEKEKNDKNQNQVYHGEIQDVELLKNVIDSCQVIIVPSFSEGMPNVILEAMARGLAVIATEVGAVPNMISEKNGRLIPPGNRRDLKHAIKELANMSDKDLDQMRQSSLQIVKERFRWSVIADKTLETIREVTFSNNNNRLEK